VTERVPAARARGRRWNRIAIGCLAQDTMACGMRGAAGPAMTGLPAQGGWLLPAVPIMHWLRR